MSTLAKHRSTPAAPTATPARPVRGVRPEIQGLRAVAVLLVVTYHLWPHLITGGYVGVDAFFVVSGFLISSHLLREVESTGRVRLAAFWARRVRRLLPAACLVLAATAVGVAVWVPRLMWEQFYKEIGASTLYVENWSLARDAVDYLASSNQASPVQHYWTLSAEEQFYVCWPLLISAALGLAWLASRRRPSGGRRLAVIAAILGAATAASLGYSLWETRHNPSAAYFITPARAWEFGAGAMLAVANRPRVAPRALPAAARALLSAAGLAVLAWCGWNFTDSTPMPGVGAVVVVLAVIAVIAAGDPGVAWSPVRLLRLPPVQFLGDISYSMYLWHWPMIVLLPYALGRPIGLRARLAILIATVLLAWLTKRFVEDPVRSGRRFGLRRSTVSFAWAALGAAVLVTACAGATHVIAAQTARDHAAALRLEAQAPPCFGAAAVAPGARGCPESQFDDTILPSPTAASHDYPDFPGCDAQMRVAPLRGCAFGDVHNPAIPHIAVVGDSHARVVGEALLPLVKAGRLSFDLFAVGGCTWSTGPPNIHTKALRDACVVFKRRLTDLLARTAKNYDFIVTTSWAQIMGGSPGSQVKSIVAAWRPIAAQGVPIVAIRDNPSSGVSPATNPNNCLATVSAQQANAKCSLDRQKALDGVFDPYSEAVRRTPGAHHVDLSDFYCQGRRCPAVIGGVDVYRDNSHVTNTYAETMAPYYYRAFVSAGVLG